MQLSFFDLGCEKLKITKPIRLIELFGGYGSQSLALKYLGVKFEHWKLCEWAVKSIQAYKDMHYANDNTDYSQGLSFDEIIDFLADRGISADYNSPMSKEQIKRMGESKCRTVYNNIKATKNLVSVCNVKGADLNITDTDKYEYIMTYSFPCQDLSLAGLGKGMQKGSGTRSGLLWEVERILDECENKPQILLMENVPEVIGTNNIKDFAKWLERLESWGYKCYWKCLNAKEYGIPQNRNRCFMVSVLENRYYDFPKTIKLENKLKDLLEPEVDEKYYLSDRALNGTLNTNFQCSSLEKRLPKDGITPTICARDYKDPKLIAEPKLWGGIGEINFGSQYRQGNRIYDSNAIACALMAEPIGNAGGNSYLYKVDEPNLKTKLCNELIASGKVKENDVIRHSYSNNRLSNGEKNMGRIENHEGLSPTLDTRCDCLGVCVKDSKIEIDEDIKNSVKTVFEEEEEILKAVEKGKELYKSRQGFSAENSLGIKCSPTLKAGNPNTYCILKSESQHLKKNIEKFGIGEETVAIDTYNQTRNDCMQTIRANINQRNEEFIQTNYRIRKLTPRECGRLMGVKDEDIDKLSKNQSNASMYHIFGDSIVCDVLMAIFGEMLGINWEIKAKEKGGKI